MPRRNRNSPNATGRSPKNKIKGRFVAIPFSVMKSPAYRSLTPTARALLFEIAMLENSENNGQLYLSVRDARDRLGLGDTKAVTKAFDELLMAHLIVITKEAQFVRLAPDISKARSFALTWRRILGKSGASDAYLGYAPAPKKAASLRAQRGLAAINRFERRWGDMMSMLGNFPTNRP